MIIAAFNVFLHTVCVCFPLFWMVGIELLIYSNGKNLFSMLMSFCAIKCDEWIRSIDSIFFPPVRLFFLMFFFPMCLHSGIWNVNFQFQHRCGRCPCSVCSLLFVCVFFCYYNFFIIFYIGVRTMRFACQNIIFHFLYTISRMERTSSRAWIFLRRLMLLLLLWLRWMSAHFYSPKWSILQHTLQKTPV